MKSGLIIKLIEAHCTGSEEAFKKALRNLANDEERKGNVSLSASIMNAYSTEKKSNISFSSSPLSEITFSTQSSFPTPKDRDSTLELIEILHPKVRLNDVALPDRTREALLQIIDEQKKLINCLLKVLLQPIEFCFAGLQDVERH